MPFEELVRAHHVLALHHSEDPPRIRRIVEKTMGETASDRVVHGVAGHSGDDQCDEDDLEPDRTSGGECASGEQERVTGKKWRDDETGFGKDDGEENSVGQRAVVLNECREVFIEVQDEIYHSALDSIGQPRFARLQDPFGEGHARSRSEDSLRS